MKYSVFYHHICRAAEEAGCSVGDMLSRVRRWGVSHVELDRDNVGREDQQILALGHLLQENGLQPSSIYGFYDWSAGSLPAADDLLLRQAALLGCPRVMVIPGFYADTADETRCAGEKAGMLAGTRQFTELAAQQGLTVTIECFDDVRSPIATIAGMAEFLDAVPQLMVTLETGNFLFSGDDILLALDRFRSRIRHVHLKDRYLPGRVPGGAPAKMLTGSPVTSAAGEVMYPCAVGQGHIPIPQVIAELARRGYGDVMTIEHFGVASYGEAIRASIGWLKAEEAEL